MMMMSLLFPSALSDPSSRLSTSPPPPAIAVPLLEMGFSLRQITKALEATGQSICSNRPIFVHLQIHEVRVKRLYSRNNQDVDLFFLPKILNVLRMLPTFSSCVTKFLCVITCL